MVYEITDPMTAFVKVHDLDDAIQDMALASIKKVLRNLSLEEMYARSEELDDQLCEMGRKLLQGWGVQIHNIFLSDLSHAMVIRHLGPQDNPAVITGEISESAE